MDPHNKNRDQDYFELIIFFKGLSRCDARRSSMQLPVRSRMGASEWKQQGKTEKNF